MSTPNGVHEFPVDAKRVRPAVLSETRPLYWSVRRELWENRSIYLAPLIVTVIVLFASLLHSMTVAKRMRNLPTDPVKRHTAIVKPYSMPPAPIMLATFIVGIFYALDAFHGERRDRSILFWKSVPVSDRTTVLAKASIPFLVLPLIAFILGAATQLLLLLASTMVLLMKGMSPLLLWREFRYPQEPMVMIYGLTVHVLWFAPIYAWLLLLSAWARRSPVLWAVLPPLALAAFERLVFNTTYFPSFLKDRVIGAMTRAFATHEPGSAGIIDRLDQLTPGRFLSTPGLWAGLIFTAVCLVAAMRLRRKQEPI
jgi:ABC-2 type transport system permease protein